ncbi:MAG: PD-(D/E)XK nuclease family protein [Sphingobacteriia bacterium]|nr:PD-(D/E)XK nuclease family protein [Sphingobacteriia bacterium]
MSLFFITPQNNFIPSVIEGCKTRLKIENNDFKHIIILVPSRRIARFFEEEFLKQSDKYKLPKILPILDAFGLYDRLVSEHKLPDRAEQQLIFAEKYSKHFNVNFREGFELYDLYDKLLNDCFISNVTVEELNKIEASELALHAQNSKNILEFILKIWREDLKGRNKYNYPDFIELQIEELKKRLENSKHPIIFAGFSIEYKPLEPILKYAALSKKHMLILPFDEEEVNNWEDNLKPFAPFYNIYNFISENKLSIENFIITKKINRPHISYTELANVREEANFIVQEVIKNKDKKIAIICGDKLLQTYLVTKLKIKGLNPDVTEGIPFTQHDYFLYLLNFATIISNEFDIINLLSILKSGFTTLDFEDYLSEVYLFESEVLRGNFRINSFEDLLYSAHEVGKESHVKFATLLNELFSPLKNISKNSNFRNIIDLHLELISKFENIDIISEDIKEIKDTITNIVNIFDNYHFRVNPKDYVNIFYNLFVDKKLYNSEANKNIRIMSINEAKLVSADMVILSSCNEENWIPDINSRLVNSHIRKILGLSLNDHEITKVATLFYQLINSPTVLLTRSLQNSEGITTRLRWIHLISLKHDINLINYNKEQIKDVVELSTPEDFNPPIASRPKKLSVTKLEMYIKDPYTVYAENILKLKPLGKLIKETTRQDFGIYVHAMVEYLVKNFSKIAGKEHFLKLVNSFGKRMLDEVSLSIYEPKINKNFSWIYDYFYEAINSSRSVSSEITGQITLNDFIITARADIIIVKNDQVIVIDFKTGALPSEKSIKEFQVLQLAVISLIVKKGIIGSLKLNSKNDKIECKYLKFNQTSEDMDEKSFEITEELFEKLEDTLKDIINKFLYEPFSVNGKYYKDYPNSPYIHLSRSKI